MVFSCATKKYLTSDGFIEQIMVKNCHCSHCFNDRYGAWKYAWVVASACLDNGSLSVDVHSFLFAQKRCHGLECYAETDIGSVADAALNASAVVCPCGDAALSIGDEDIILFAAACANAGKSLAIFKSLNRVDSEHGRAQFGMQFAESRRSKSNGAALYHAGDDAADGVAVGFDFRDELRHFCGLFHIRAAHGVLFNLAEVEFMVVALQANRADLRCVCRDVYAELFQHEFGQSAANTTGDGFTCRRASASTMVAEAVFAEISVVGMTWAKRVAQVVVVVRMLVFVAYKKTYGATRGASLENARQQFDAVSLLS